MFGYFLITHSGRDKIENFTLAHTQCGGADGARF